MSRRRVRRPLCHESLERRHLLSVAPGGSDTFAYFLDTINDANVALTMPTSSSATPISTVIGEAGAAQRAKWTSGWTLGGETVDARIVGESLGLNDGAPGRNLWPVISTLFSSTTPVTGAAAYDLAVSILSAVMSEADPAPGQPGSEFPAAAESLPTGDGGYVIWAQDFEFQPGVAATNDVYAGVTAVLWAGRQVLSHDLPSGQSPMKIVPVPSSSLFKTLGDPTHGYLDTQLILKGGSGTPYLAALGLEPLPQTNTVTQTNPHGEWNFLSTLYANDLIDGFLGQQYSVNNPAAVPGSVSEDTLAFYPGHAVPFAIQSAHDLPTQLQGPHDLIGSPPWPSRHAGDLPFGAGVYWAQAAIDPLSAEIPAVAFDPADFLTPTPQPLAEIPASAAGLIDLNADGVRDLVWRSDAAAGHVGWVRDAAGAVVAQRFLGGDADWAIEATGDFDGNGATDLVWRQASTGAAVQWLLRDDGSVGAARMLPAGDGDRVVAAADHDGNGTTDLAWRNTLSGRTTLWLMNGDRVVDQRVLGGDGLWRLVRTSQAFDGNSDGRADLLWRQADTGATVAWFMNGLEVIGTTFVGGDLDWLVDDVADFDGDARSDLVWRHAATGTVVAWVGIGASRSDLFMGGDADWRIVAVQDLSAPAAVEVSWLQRSTGFVVGRTLAHGIVTSAAVQGGGPGWSPTGTTAAAQPNLVLWHEGYKTPLGTLFQPAAWQAYTSAIVDFAASHGIGTVMTSLIFSDTAGTLPADAATFLQTFVTAAEAKGLVAGICVSFGKTTTFAEAAATLAGITHARPLLLGVDVENFVGTSIPVPKATTVMADVVVPFQQALAAADVTFSRIAVIGGMAVDPSWVSPMTNVYEYYSDGAGLLNRLFNANRNQPAQALTAFQTAVAGTVGSNDPIVAPAGVGGWPAFAISRADADCLGGCGADPAKTFPCGIADIFGQWSWQSFAGFLGGYQDDYAPESIVIYQGDQLPCDWLGGACPTDDT